MTGTIFRFYVRLLAEIGLPCYINFMCKLHNCSPRLILKFNLSRWMLFTSIGSNIYILDTYKYTLKVCVYKIMHAEESETSSEADEDSDLSCFDEEDVSWITWFCSQKGNEFFCEVEDDYILDDFNLSGLRSLFKYYEYALDLILDAESSHGTKLLNYSNLVMYNLNHHEFLSTIYFAYALINLYTDDSFTYEKNNEVESEAEMLYGLIHVRYISTSKGMTAMVGG